MAKIEIYTSQFCFFCKRAKALLDQKNAPFTEIDLDANPKLRKEMVERANGSYTVPQIFINDNHIGGSDDLYDLEEQGKLDDLLSD